MRYIMVNDVDAPCRVIHNDLLVILDSLLLFWVTSYYFIIITNSVVNTYILFDYKI